MPVVAIGYAGRDETSVRKKNSIGFVTALQRKGRGMERLIEEYRRRWLEAFDKEWNHVNVLPKGYEMKITPQPWISVSESLPGMGERVMIAHAVDKWIDVGERDIIGSYEYWSDDGEELGQPTHWMPLPAPPTE